MSGEKSTAWAADILALLFNATAVANIAINATASPLTQLYVALHTADPGAGGTQLTNEVGYTGYARVAVARTSGGWVITGASVSPAANVSFPACTSNAGGTPTATNFSIGTAASGAGVLLYSGPLAPTIAIANGVTPVVAAATTITEA